MFFKILMIIKNIISPVIGSQLQYDLDVIQSKVKGIRGILHWNIKYYYSVKSLSFDFYKVSTISYLYLWQKYFLLFSS